MPLASDDLFCSRLCQNLSFSELLSIHPSIFICSKIFK